MRQKLHYGRRKVFQRRRPLLRILQWGITALAVIAVGFFGAKYISEHPVKQPVADPTSSAGDVSTPDNVSSEPDEALSATTNTLDVAKALRAFYLPASALSNETALSETLRQAGAAGYNTVVVEMKDANGVLHFRSGTDLAAKVNNFSDRALTVEQLRAVFAAIRQAGIQPVARLFAFRDHAAARALPDARITVVNTNRWVWYDGDPKGGGRAWLNPYADEAHLYIIDLARELKDAGASAILLDGVEFPAYTGKADFGTSSNVTLGRAEILTAFIEQTRRMLGNDCPVILSCSQDSATGGSTQIYGNNPLTFTSNIAAPMLAVSKIKVPADSTASDALQTMIKQMVTRIKVIPEESQPRLAPMLPTAGLSVAEIRQQLDACLAGGTDSYILYDPAGQYDFAGLHN